MGGQFPFLIAFNFLEATLDLHPWRPRGSKLGWEKRQKTFSAD